jgi:hypothetical protein
MSFIENLDASLNTSRPVNSGVMSALRLHVKKSPAAPLLCDGRVEWIMREAG